MSAGLLLQLGLFGIAGLLLILAIAVATRRWYRNVIEAKHLRQEAAVRPYLLEALAESEDASSVDKLIAITGGDAKAMERLAWQFLTKVRGSSREVLVDVLRQRGAIETERLRTHKIGVVGRAKAAEHLGAAGEASTVSDLVRLLDDRKAEVRIVAARGLGKLGNAEAIPSLLKALESDKRIPASIISMSIIHIGPTAIDQLTQSLSSDSSVVRVVCAQILGMHGAVGSAQLLAQLVEQDLSLDVRVEAAHALGRIGSPQSVQPLIHALSPSQPPALRIAAATALGFVGGSKTIDALREVVFADDDRVASAAAHSLAHLGNAGEAQLIEIAKSETNAGFYARQAMARSLVDINALRRRSVSGVS